MKEVFLTRVGFPCQLYCKKCSPMLIGTLAFECWRISIFICVMLLNKLSLSVGRITTTSFYIFIHVMLLKKLSLSVGRITTTSFYIFIHVMLLNKLSLSVGRITTTSFYIFIHVMLLNKLSLSEQEQELY